METTSTCDILRGRHFYFLFMVTLADQLSALLPFTFPKISTVSTASLGYWKGPAGHTRSLFINLIKANLVDQMDKAITDHIVKNQHHENDLIIASYTYQIQAKRANAQTIHSLLIYRISLQPSPLHDRALWMFGILHASFKRWLHQR